MRKNFSSYNEGGEIMYDIYINDNVVLTVNEMTVARRIADSIKEVNREGAIVVRRHRCDIGDLYVA